MFMIYDCLKKYKNWILLFLILFLIALTFAIRVLPAPDTSVMGEIRLPESDPYYNLRQIEVMVHNFPQYDWFDPMTGYPTGKVIDWGPLIPLISASLSIIFGATTQSAIIHVSSFVPVIFAMIMVPIVYFTGKILYDWKAGIIAATLISVIGGEYYKRTSFGYIGHSSAEILFSTLFCLIYILLLLYFNKKPFKIGNFQSISFPLILAISAGAVYLFGLLSIPTILLFAFICAIFTIIAFNVNFYQDRKSDHIFFINGITFATVIAGYLMFGVHVPGTSLSQYSIGQVYVYLLIIGETCFLFILARFLQGRKKNLYPAITGLSAIFSMLILEYFAPAFLEIFINAGGTFFGRPVSVLQINELMPWSVNTAWSNFNVGLFLAIGGVLVLAWLYKKNLPDMYLFVLVWTAIVFISTLLHTTYEYYLAVLIAIFSGIFFGYIIKIAEQHDIFSFLKIRNANRSEHNNIYRQTGKRTEKGRKPKKKLTHSESKPFDPVIIVFAGTIVLLLIFGGSSLYIDYRSSHSISRDTIDPVWIESLHWLINNTPDPGVDYYGTYENPGYVYPSSSYGILSWWDYGHWITVISRRIPITNPFQQHLEGPISAPAFFMTASEQNADNISTGLGARYIITSSDMTNSIFPSISVWYNYKRGLSPYLKQFRLSATDNPNTFYYYAQPYFDTMVARLQNADGSELNPTKVIYAEFSNPKAGSDSVPVIHNSTLLDIDLARSRASVYNSNAPAGSQAMLFSSQVNEPIQTVPALEHYRLIHESDRTLPGIQTNSQNIVKIFERVKGAKIQGNGTIELALVTNTGRNFTYRQSSVNNLFIVPYSTMNNQYDVKATGKYHIIGTTREFEVNESDVINGVQIN